LLNLKTAVQVGEVMQDFELELHPPNVDHSQTVKATFGGCSYSSKGCVNLPASTAVFRLNIAEGAGESSPNEKVRFYRMARRSAIECAGILDWQEQQQQG